MSSGDQLAVHAERRRTADLEVEVGRVALHHLLQDGLEVERRRRAAGSRGCRTRSGSAIGIDPEEDLTVLHRLRVLDAELRVTTPANSDSISFMIFIASMMQTICPLATRVPTVTYGLAPGSGTRRTCPPSAT